MVVDTHTYAHPCTDLPGDLYICNNWVFLTQEYKLQVSETDALRKYLDQKGFKLKGKVKSVVRLWCSGM